MEKLTINDVISLSTYRTVRDEFRRKMIQEKNDRRVELGNKFTFLFENRNTALLQVEEMIWIESITDENEIRHLLDAYNSLVPGQNELSATLFINLEAVGYDALDKSKVKTELDRYLGIEDSVFLGFGTERIRAEFEPGRTSADLLSTVQYLNFRLLPRHVQWFRDPGKKVMLEIDHSNVKLSAEISGVTRGSLIRDLDS